MEKVSAINLLFCIILPNYDAIKISAKIDFTLIIKLI